MVLTLVIAIIALVLPLAGVTGGQGSEGGGNSTTQAVQGQPPDQLNNFLPLYQAEGGELKFGTSGLKFENNTLSQLLDVVLDGPSASGRAVANQFLPASDSLVANLGAIDDELRSSRELSGTALGASSLSFDSGPLVGTSYTVRDAIQTVSVATTTGGVAATSAPPAASDTVGAPGVLQSFAREDHQHPSQGVSADTHNVLSVGSDGLHTLPLDPSGFARHLSTSDDTLQKVANRLDQLELGFVKRGVVTSDANSGPGFYNLDSAGGVFTFTLDSATGSQRQYLFYGINTGSNAVALASASTIQGVTSVDTDGQFVLVADIGAGLWYAVDLGGTAVDPSTSVAPASSNSTGAVGTSAEFARGDHQHPAQSVSGDANNVLSNGADGLAYLRLDQLELGFFRRGVVVNGTNSGPGIYGLDSAGGPFAFPLGTATGSQSQYLFHGINTGVHAVTLASASAIQGVTVVNTSGQIVLVVDRSAGQWDAVTLGLSGSGAVSTDANNILVSGADSLPSLPLDAASFSQNLAPTDTTLQAVANAVDATHFRNRGLLSSDTDAGPGVYVITSGFGTFNLPAPTGAGHAYLFHAPNGASTSVTLATASGTVSGGPTAVTRNGQVLLAMDHTAGQWQVVELSVSPTFRGAWAPTTGYALGEQVVTPTGALVSSVAGHTSQAAFDATEAAEWSVNTPSFVQASYVGGGYYYAQQLALSPVGNVIVTSSDHTGEAAFDATEAARWVVHGLNTVPVFAGGTSAYVSGELLRAGGQVYVVPASFAPQQATLAGESANVTPISLDRLKPLDFLAGTEGVAVQGAGVYARVLAADNTTAALELQDTSGSATTQHRFPWGGTFALGDLVQVRWVLEQDTTQAQHVVSVGLRDNVNTATTLVQIGSAALPSLVTADDDNAVVSWTTKSRVFSRGNHTFVEVDQLIEWKAASSAPVEFVCVPVFNLDGTTTADASALGSCVVRSVDLQAPEEVVREPLQLLSQAQTALMPGAYNLDSSGAGFNLTLANVIGVWRFYNSNYSLGTNSVTLGTASHTFSSASGAQVAGPLTLDVGGKQVTVLHNTRGNDFGLSIESGNTNLNTTTEPNEEQLFLGTNLSNGALVNPFGQYTDLAGVISAGFQRLRLEVAAVNGGSPAINQDWRSGEVTLESLQPGDRAIVVDISDSYILIKMLGDPITGVELEHSGVYNSVAAVRITAIRAQTRVIPTTDVAVNDQTASGFMDVGNMRHMWGDNVEGAGVRTITFPAAFASTAYSLVVTPKAAASAATNVLVGFAESGGARTTSGTSGELLEHTDGTNTVGQSAQGFSWVAFGPKP